MKPPDRHLVAIGSRFISLHPDLRPEQALKLIGGKDKAARTVSVTLFRLLNEWAAQEDGHWGDGPEGELPWAKAIVADLFPEPGPEWIAIKEPT